MCDLVLLIFLLWKGSLFSLEDNNLCSCLQDEQKYEEALKGALWKEHVARLSVTVQVRASAPLPHGQLLLLETL